METHYLVDCGQYAIQRTSNLRDWSSGTAITGKPVGIHVTVATDFCGRYAFLRSTESKPDKIIAPSLQSSLIRAAAPAKPGALERSKGAIVKMFPDLGELKPEEIDKAIEDVRKRRLD